MTIKSRYATCRFCPHCGVESLDRDFYAQGGEAVREQGHRESVRSGCEYLCRICGFGFRIMKSKRTELAEEIQKQHRQIRRRDDKFKESCVLPEVVEAFQRAASEKGKP